MDINSFILQEIHDNLQDYGLDEETRIKKFLDYNNNYEYRLNDGLHIIKNILAEHGKSQIADHLYDLSKLEPVLGNIDIESRDHVLHTLQTYILGVYLSESFLLPQGVEIRPFTWKIACLFHDIGYPVKIAQEMLKKYSDRNNCIRDKHIKNISPVFHFQIRPTGIENLCNSKKSLPLIQKCLDGWDLDIPIQSEYEEMIETGSIRHRAMSALTGLNSIDLFYQKYNPERKFEKILEPYTNIDCNQKYFEEDIIPACAAIYIHDISPKYLPYGKRIDRKKAPLAFLLKLSDSLQEWQRPNKIDNKGLNPNLFEIRIDGRRLIMNANIPDKAKIQKEIDSCLNAPDIQIN